MIADKITAELMALHDAAIVKFNAALGDTNAESVNAASDARKALEQAIRRAVDWKQVGVSLYNPPSLSYGVKWSITEPLLHGTPIYVRSQHDNTR